MCNVNANFLVELHGNVLGYTRFILQMKTCFWNTNLGVTTDYPSRITQIACNHQIYLQTFCVIMTEMLFTQSNV